MNVPKKISERMDVLRTTIASLQAETQQYHSELITLEYACAAFLNPEKLAVKRGRPRKVVTPYEAVHGVLAAKPKRARPRKVVTPVTVTVSETPITVEQAFPFNYDAVLDVMRANPQGSTWRDLPVDHYWRMSLLRRKKLAVKNGEGLWVAV